MVQDIHVCMCLYRSCCIDSFKCAPCPIMMITCVHVFVVKEWAFGPDPPTFTRHTQSHNTYMYIVYVLNYTNSQQYMHACIHSCTQANIHPLFVMQYACTAQQVINLLFISFIPVCKGVCGCMPLFLFNPCSSSLFSI